MDNNRENQILNLLSKEGSVRIDNLAEILSLSAITIRRELKRMEQKGLVERFHGGAILPSTAEYGFEPTLVKREASNKSKKTAIAKAAVDLIKKGEVIVIDLGTTGMEIAKALRGYNDITVFTASLPIANILMKTNKNVYLFGGLVQGKEKCVGGAIARKVISHFYFDKFFLGVSGVSLEYGITDFGIDEIEIKYEIMKRSREVICVADSTKFENNMFIKICEYTDVDKIITDSSLSPVLRQKYEKGGLAPIIAE